MERTTKLADEHVQGLPDGLLVGYRIWAVAPLDTLHI